MLQAKTNFSYKASEALEILTNVDAHEVNSFQELRNLRKRFCQLDDDKMSSSELRQSEFEQYSGENPVLSQKRARKNQNKEFQNHQK